MYTVVLPQLSVRSFLTGRTVSGRCRRAEILSGDKSNIPYPALPVKPDAEIARLSALDGMNPADFAMVVISGVTGSAFTWSAFMAGALLNAIPGIILHIVLIPILVMALKRAKVLDA